MLAELNWADYAILATIGVSALISLVRGFVREFFSLLSWAVALFVAVAFQADMSQQLLEFVDKPYVRDALGYVILFVGTLIVMSLLTNLMSLLVSSTGLDGTDRMLGMVFGAMRGGVVVLAMVVLMPSLLNGVEQDLWWKESVLIPEFQTMSDWSKAAFVELVQWVQDLIQRVRGGATT